MAISIFFSGCALSPAQRQAEDSDWALARSIHGEKASPLHREIFGDGPLDGTLYRRFFDARVRELRSEGIAFASCHGAFACTEEKTVRISSSYPELPEVVRLSFLLHEARHAEGFDHVICPKDLRTVSPFQKKPLAGTRECDETALGANGVQIVMLKNVAEFCTSCVAGTRREADQFADYLLELVSPQARKILRKDFSN